MTMSIRVHAVRSLLIGAAALAVATPAWAQTADTIWVPVSLFAVPMIIAAGALYALENNVVRLADDHRNAEKLARGLRELGLEAQLSTNMVLLKIAPEKAAPLQAHMKAQGVLVLPRAPMRLVTHLDVDANGIDRALGAFKSFFGVRAPSLN